jgi:hypothetical protein
MNEASLLGYFNSQGHSVQPVSQCPTIKVSGSSFSRSSVGRSILVYARMASDILVPHYLLRCSPPTSSLVSTLPRIRSLTISLLPETLRSLVGDGSIPPPMLNCTPQAYRRRRREEKQAEKEGRPPVLVDRPPRVPVSSAMGINVIQLTVSFAHLHHCAYFSPRIWA